MSDYLWQVEIFLGHVNLWHDLGLWDKHIFIRKNTEKVEKWLQVTVELNWCYVSQIQK